MWLVNPRLMCRQHLLGEHVELHMTVGSIVRGKSLAGFLETGLIDPALIVQRHLELVEEMERRGYSHNCELPSFAAPHLVGANIDEAANLLELKRRCKKCAARIRREKTKPRKIQKTAKKRGFRK